jgi:AraC-like DNA-binding protein
MGVRKMTNRLYFNTDGLPERDRFSAYCDGIIRHCAALDIVDRSGGQKFRAAIEMQRAGTVFVANFKTSPSDYFRSSQLMRDGDDALCVTLCVNGKSVQTQREDPQILLPGEGIVCDNGRVGGINVLTDGQFWSLKIPRPRITSQISNMGQFAGRKLNGDPIALRLLFGYLAGTIGIDLVGDGRAAALHDEHIINLVALALGAQGDARELSEQRTGRAARCAAILRDLARHMSDPDLNAVAVAGRLGITPRYLRMVLEETGRSFTEHLLDKRLDQAAAMLRDPSGSHRRIGEIAFACGFGDLSYFNRVFRRRYGGTPSDIREGSRRDDV